MPYRVNTKRRQKGYGPRKRSKGVHGGRLKNIKAITMMPKKRGKQRDRIMQRGYGKKLDKLKKAFKKTSPVWNPIARSLRDKLADKVGLDGLGKHALNAAYDAAIGAALK